MMDRTPSNKKKRTYDEFDATPPPPPRYITTFTGPSTVPVPWANEPDIDLPSYSESGSGHISIPRSWTPPPFPAAPRTFSSHHETYMNSPIPNEGNSKPKEQVDPTQATKKRLGADGKGRDGVDSGQGERELSDKEKVKLELGKWEIERMTRYNNDEDFRRAWDVHGRKKDDGEGEKGGGQGERKEKKVIMFTVSDGEDEDDDDEMRSV